MDVQTAPRPDAAAPASLQARETAGQDRLGAEVRESLLLLALCVGVTAGLSAAAQALLALAG